MKVGVFSTCLVSLMRPSIAFSTLDLLRQAGVNPVIPKSQTCCGQPALNSGIPAHAAKFTEKFVDEFDEFDKIIFPSGSCASTIKFQIDSLLSNDVANQAAIDLKDKCVELATFLVEIGFEPSKIAEPLTVAYHDSCAGLRELGIKLQPRQLLEAAGYKLVTMQNEEVCCGFGGLFSVKYGEISGHMADEKCQCALSTDADVLAMGDLGCILNIEGRMLRLAKPMPVMHFAELLAPQPTT